MKLNISMMTNEELQSKCISLLRFPLIVGVIFIHTNNPLFINGIDLNAGTWPVYHEVVSFFSNVLGRISVPLFFFMSGYLFFYKVEWSKEAYLKKLSNRKWSLLVPYLFWNILGILIIGLLQILLPSFVSGTRKLVSDWSFFDFIKAFWVSDDYYPFVAQFWFIRDLMLVVLLTPCIYFLIKYGKYWSVLLLGLLWYFHVGITLPGLSWVSIFFFSAGAYFSINRLNLIASFSGFFRFSLPIYLIMALADLSTKGANYNSYLHNAGILIGIPTCFYLATLYLNKESKKINNFLTSAAFFVFAIHEPYYAQMRKLIYKAMKPDSDLELVFLYFVSVVLVIWGALAVYFILKKMFPRFTRVISGGR